MPLVPGATTIARNSKHKGLKSTVSKIDDSSLPKKNTKYGFTTDANGSRLFIGQDDVRIVYNDDGTILYRGDMENDLPNGLGHFKLDKWIYGRFKNARLIEELEPPTRKPGEVDNIFIKTTVDLESRHCVPEE